MKVFCLFLLMVASISMENSANSSEMTIRNKKCTFPFVYKGKSYDYCTKAGGDKYWCSHDAVYDGGFEHCLPSSCVFPFTYKKVKYDTCTNAEVNYYWCSDGDKYFTCSNFVEVKPVVCYDRNYKIRQPGERWIRACITYECSKKGTIEEIKVDCIGVNGKCHSLGQSNYECLHNGQLYTRCTCNGRFNDVDNIVDTESLFKNKEEVKPVVCYDRNDKIRQPGERWTQACITYECSKKGTIEEINSECPGVNDLCHPAGSSNYKCLKGGKTYTRCICSGRKNEVTNLVDDTSLYNPEDVEVKEDKKTVLKLCYDPQGNVVDTWKRGCTEYFCDKGISRVRKQSCRDDDNNCFDLDKSGFKCKIERELRTCSCELTSDGPTLIAYNG